MNEYNHAINDKEARLIFHLKW